jgi:hypothetical protein
MPITMGRVCEYAFIVKGIEMTRPGYFKGNDVSGFGVQGTGFSVRILSQGTSTIMAAAKN